MTNPTPPRQPDCRVSNLVLEGGRSMRYRPNEHEGECGDVGAADIPATEWPIDPEEDEDRILYGRCGTPPAPTSITSDAGVIYP